MINNKVWVLLAKKMAGEATPEELSELQFLITEEGTDAPQMLELLEKILQLPTSNTDDNSADKAWDRLSSNILIQSITSLKVEDEAETEDQISAKFLKSSTKQWLAFAFISLMLFSGYILYTKNSHTVTQSLHLVQNEVNTRPGSKTNILLPDGTKVWLNSGTKLKYKKDFLQNREIELSGEAFFDVVHLEKNPFIIRCNQVNIKVLGTAFNVKAYSDDNTVETCLLRGLIELNTDNDPERKFLLKPNEKIIVSNLNLVKSDSLQEFSRNTEQVINNLYSIVPVQFSEIDSVAEDIAWMENKLIFKSETFEMLAKKMERWYDVSFQFQSDASRQIKFTGVLDNQNIEQALKALQFSCNFKFDYTINKTQITIKPTKSIMQKN